MELGEKLKQARIEAGLSQRQLCGDMITRNMLSRVENGFAKPSMETLRYLAAQLGKPVSYFLDEEALLSPNQNLMSRAKVKWSEGNAGEVWLMLQSFQLPDPLLEWEWRYLSFQSAMAVAQKAMEDKRDLYARQILEEAEKYENGMPGLRKQRLLLMGIISGVELTDLVKQLPSLDEELLLRAEAALIEKDGERAAKLLDAAEDQSSPKWNFFRGKADLLRKQYAQAAEYLLSAEHAYPTQCWPLLETCFRELGDFKQAYEYACKQR